MTDTWIGVVGDIFRLADALCKTAFVPKSMQGNPAAVAAAMLTGREMHIEPMAALAGIDVIDGKPSISADLQLRLVFDAGHHVEWLHSDTRKATVKITRGDGLSTATVTYTIDDAKQAGLAGKTNWTKHPAAMLRARAITACIGMVCPDIGRGLQAREIPDDRPAQTITAAPEPDDERASITQLRQIGAALGVLEASAPDGGGKQWRQQTISAIVGAPVGSAGDLTADQAATVINHLLSSADTGGGDNEENSTVRQEPLD